MTGTNRGTNWRPPAERWWSVQLATVLRANPTRSRRVRTCRLVRYVGPVHSRHLAGPGNSTSPADRRAHRKLFRYTRGEVVTSASRRATRKGVSCRGRLAVPSDPREVSANVGPHQGRLATEEPQAAGSVELGCHLVGGCPFSSTMSHQIASELRWPRWGENRSLWSSQGHGGPRLRLAMPGVHGGSTA
jgi:hypothetical protein